MKLKLIIPILFIIILSFSAFSFVDDDISNNHYDFSDFGSERGTVLIYEDSDTIAVDKVSGGVERDGNILGFPQICDLDNDGYKEVLSFSNTKNYLRLIEYSPEGVLSYTDYDIPSNDGIIDIACVELADSSGRDAIVAVTKAEQGTGERVRIQEYLLNTASDTMVSTKTYFSDDGDVADVVEAPNSRLTCKSNNNGYNCFMKVSTGNTIDGNSYNMLWLSDYYSELPYTDTIMLFDFSDPGYNHGTSSSYMYQMGATSRTDSDNILMPLTLLDDGEVVFFADHHVTSNKAVKVFELNLFHVDYVNDNITVYSSDVILNDGYFIGLSETVASLNDKNNLGFIGVHKRPGRTGKELYVSYMSRSGAGVSQSGLLGIDGTQETDSELAWIYTPSPQWDGIDIVASTPIYSVNVASDPFGVEGSTDEVCYSMNVENGRGYFKCSTTNNTRTVFNIYETYEASSDIFEYPVVAGAINSYNTLITHEVDSDNYTRYDGFNGNFNSYPIYFDDPTIDGFMILTDLNNDGESEIVSITAETTFIGTGLSTRNTGNIYSPYIVNYYTEDACVADRNVTYAMRECINNLACTYNLDDESTLEKLCSSCGGTQAYDCGEWSGETPAIICTNLTDGSLEVEFKLYSQNLDSSDNWIATFSKNLSFSTNNETCNDPEYYVGTPIQGGENATEISGEDVVEGTPTYENPDDLITELLGGVSTLWKIVLGICLVLGITIAVATSAKNVPPFVIGLTAVIATILATALGLLPAYIFILIILVALILIVVAKMTGGE